MKLVKNSKLCALLRVNGITLYPFVFVKSSEPSQTLLNHEMIHVMQIRRLGVFSFYLRYLREYFQNRLRGMAHREAYLSISFEKEAREYQGRIEEYKRRWRQV